MNSLPMASHGHTREHVGGPTVCANTPHCFESHPAAPDVSRVFGESVKMIAMTPTHDTAILLFAHGSRDPAWRLPLDAVLEQVQSQHPGPCRLAFLELMQPSLPDALAELAGLGCSPIRVMPLFWAAGKHVNRDLINIVAAFLEEHPEVRVEIAAPLGDNPQMRRAIADWALDARPL
jgi:sirohydrochlorin cobaltochelatase